MVSKLKKRFRLTKSERTFLKNYKDRTGMTYSSIAEKAILSFINSERLISIQPHNAKHKDYIGEIKSETLPVYLNKNVLENAETYMVEHTIKHLSDLFNSAIRMFCDYQ